MTRYVVLDFETNGLRGAEDAPKRDWPLPFANSPIQVPVEIVEDGAISHAFDSWIKGAKQLSAWTREHVPVSMEELQRGRFLEDVLEELSGLLRDDDVLVSHNTNYDLSLVIGKYARIYDREDEQPYERILEWPRFCTMQNAYSRANPQTRDMAGLCQHFGVKLEAAHDARQDAAALAKCVAIAWQRGVMLEPRIRVPAIEETRREARPEWRIPGTRWRETGQWWPMEASGGEREEARIQEALCRARMPETMEAPTMASREEALAVKRFRERFSRLTVMETRDQNNVQSDATEGQETSPMDARVTPESGSGTQALETQEDTGGGAGESTTTTSEALEATRL